MRWSRRDILKAGSMAVLGGVACSPRRRRIAGQLPNIVVIYPDQLRSMALSLYGQSNIVTPHIDRLLNSGTHFPLATTANPVCTPARAATLFSRIPSTIGVEVNGHRPISGFPTLANVLQDAGYHCGYIGKWHLDGNTLPGFVAPDMRYGFQTWKAYNFHHNYMNGVYFDDDNESPVRADEYLPYAETTLGLDFMAEHADTPFFLVLSFGPPHPSHAAPTSYRGDIPADWFAFVETADMQFRHNVPSWIIPYNRGPSNRGQTEVGAKEYLTGYYAAVQSIDECVRRLVQGIDDLGLTSDTILCFASDHGDMAGSHSLFRKGVAYREATEVPLGFSWPGHIHSVASAMPASLIDIAPTLASLAGIPIPREWHGRDLSPWLLDRALDLQGSVFTEGGFNAIPWQLVRTPRWSYTVRRDNARPLSLFDNQNDPFQLINLIHLPLSTSIIEQLSTQLIGWRTRTLGLL